MPSRVSDSDLCPHHPDVERRLALHPVPAIHLVGVGSEPVSFRWHRADLRNPFWRLYLVDRPGISLVHAGGRLPYRTDALTVIPAWARFTFHVVPDVGHTLIHFDTPSLPSTQVERACPRPFHLEDADLVAAMRGLGRDLAFGPTEDGLVLRAHDLATRAWCRILGALAPPARDLLCGRGGGRLDQVLERIDRDLDQPLSLASLADGIGVGEAQLTRLFRRHLHTSPGQYLIERRVRRAADLLIQGDLDLDAIAQACGLGNRRYCTRVFSARMGMPPMRYRAVYRGNR